MKQIFIILMVCFFITAKANTEVNSCTYTLQKESRESSSKVIANTNYGKCFTSAMADLHKNLSNGFTSVKIVFVDGAGAITKLNFKGSVSRVLGSQFGDFKVEKVGANFLLSPGKSSQYRSPFLLRVPDSIINGNSSPKRILVIPNNTGKAIDDFNETLRLTIEQLNSYHFQYSDFLDTIILQPVFPREESY